MSEKEIIMKAAEMRTAQREYFRTHGSVALDKAKILERQFDAILKQYFDNDGQTSLFP